VELKLNEKNIEIKQLTFKIIQERKEHSNTGSAVLSYCKLRVVLAFMLVIHQLTHMLQHNSRARRTITPKRCREPTFTAKDTMEKKAASWQMRSDRILKWMWGLSDVEAVVARHSEYKGDSISFYLLGHAAHCQTNAAILRLVVHSCMMHASEPICIHQTCPRSRNAQLGRPRSRHFV
jgi:hypothetical protein